MKLKVELQAERKSVVNFEKSYVSHSKMTDELALKVEKEKNSSLIYNLSGMLTSAFSSDTI